MCKESNKNEWVYVVKQGECKVLKNIKPPKKDPKHGKPWELDNKFSGNQIEHIQKKSNQYN